MRLLLTVLLLALVTACGETPSEDAKAASRATDVAFVTELMHRDAALLNLLDVGLGRPLDPAVVAATEQLRVDATARIETAADQLESWGEKVPKTVRDHAFEHSSDGHDIPSLGGMPTGDDLERLGRVPRAGFEAAFLPLIANALEATRELASGLEADAAAVADLARDTTRSCATALEALSR
ncbi:MAG TPA: hypothetical protein VFY58_04475 [Nocardioides sp.]|nr:hypothetical protein [Nocardioides sp.]